MTALPLWLGLAGFVSAFASQDLERDYKISTTANLVLLEVGVKDHAGHYVPDLHAEDFSVRENGKPQKISQFSKDDAPVTIGLVIDDSGSMRAKRNEVIHSAMTFLESSNPKDEVFVIHFNDKVRHGLPEGVPFSDDPKLLQASLFRNPAEGRTALYDAIVYSLKHLASGRQEKKSLLLVSDGGDNASRHGLNAVTEAVRESQATIYTIGIFDSDDSDRNPGLLRNLAAVSGGSAFFPHQLSDLDPICRKIATDIRNRYTVGYVPDGSAERKDVRHITVSAARRGERFAVRARTSYRFPKEQH